MLQTGIKIESLTADHIAGAVTLSLEAGWPHRHDDWALALGISQGWAAIDEWGQVAGTAILTPFGATSGAISMVIVSQSLRGRGVGRRLFATAFQAAEGRRLRLTATPDGEPLYRSLGFKPFARIVQRQGTLTAVPEAAAGVVDATGGDGSAIAGLDAAAFGEDRSALLRALKQAGRFAVIRAGGAVEGFACMRRFGRGSLIGPVVAKSTQAAQDLIAHLAAGREGTFVRIDITARYRAGAMVGRHRPATDR